MKKQYVRTVETVERERERESYTLVNKGLLSELKKYIINKKDSSAIFVSILDTG